MIHPSGRRLLFQSAFLLRSHPSLACIQSSQRSLLFRFNKIAIYTGTFVNNPPLTLVPIIIASYAVGAFFMGRPVKIPPQGLELLRDPHLLTGAYYHQLFTQGLVIFVPYAVGGMVLSVVCSLIAYPLTLRALRTVRRRKAS
jgi:uncharacterized protein (DUF2062 family)